jgi:hypothetical protein
MILSINLLMYAKGVSMDKPPTVGSIVWLWSYEGHGVRKPMPAIVLEVLNPRDPRSPLNVDAFAPGELGHRTDVKYSADMNCKG